MDKQTDLITEISHAFATVEYPKKGFFQAIAERDYLEWDSQNDKKKIWHDISVDELVKYYDFLFFLDSDGIQYYLPTYMILILENPELYDHHCFDCLLMTVTKLNHSVLLKEQWCVVKSFVAYCRDVISQEIELDEDLVERSWNHIPK